MPWARVADFYAVLAGFYEGLGKGSVGVTLKQYPPGWAMQWDRQHREWVRGRKVEREGRIWTGHQSRETTGMGLRGQRQRGVNNNSR